MLLKVQLNLKSKLIEKEIKFGVARGGESEGWGSWMKMVKKYKLPVIR